MHIWAANTLCLIQVWRLFSVSTNVKIRRKLNLTCFPAQSPAATPCWTADEACRCRRTLSYSTTAGSQSTSVTTHTSSYWKWNTQRKDCSHWNSLLSFTHVIYPYICQQGLVYFFLQIKENKSLRAEEERFFVLLLLMSEILFFQTYQISKWCFNHLNYLLMISDCILQILNYLGSLDSISLIWN